MPKKDSVGNKGGGRGGGRGEGKSTRGAKAAPVGGGRGVYQSSWSATVVGAGQGDVGERRLGQEQKSSHPGSSAGRGGGRGGQSEWGAKVVGAGQVDVGERRLGQEQKSSHPGSSAGRGGGRGEGQSAWGAKVVGAGQVDVGERRLGQEQKSSHPGSSAGRGGGRGEGQSAWGAKVVGAGQVDVGERRLGQEQKSSHPGSSVAISQVRQLSISSKVPMRINKSRGRKDGKKMMVETNHLPLVLKNPNAVAFQYDVVIQPSVPKYMIRLAWNEFVSRNFPNKYPSFDGKNIAVSPVPLMDKDTFSDQFQVYNPENDKLKDYKVDITLTSKLDLGNLARFLKSQDVNVSAPLAELAVINTVLRNHASNTLVRAGRNFFRNPTNNIVSLGEGMEVWSGYYQSGVIGWKLFLNFDVTFKGFPKCDILETIEDLCLTDFPGETKRLTPETTITERRDLEKLGKHLKGLKVEYKIPECPGSKRVYKVNGIRPVPACNEIFTVEDKKTSVVDYYRDVKKYKVKYPKLPCLWVGSPTNTIYVPIELCTVLPGQVRGGKLSEKQTSNMIRHASKPPADRKSAIMNLLRSAELSNNFTNAFGISVAGEFEKIEARVLNPPELETETKISVQRGQWQVNKFLTAKPLKNWCVLTLDYPPCRYVKDFIEEIIYLAKSLGMNPESPISHGITCDAIRKPQSVFNAFKQLRDMKVQLVFVIIPDRGEMYSKVKKISEIDVGVLTQCIRSSTLNKTFSSRGTNRSTLSNILLKVNAKLNGINYSIHQVSRPKCLQCVTMIVGADVTHPPPESLTVPSIAAVAASHDTKATQYNTIRKLQPPKVEVIQDFQEIMTEQLMFFYKRTGFKPERIIIFRDGVSEGQVDIVLRNELRAIQQACISLQAGDNKMDYQPLITFLIVQKRHHTRFFPIQGNTNQNVPAGTCVDTNIVHPRDLDFYLVSHSSRLGTARPTKYKLIYDDSDMTEDELETLTYYLCHLVSRCSKSISYPAPTYYAHLAALRARVHLFGVDVDMKSAEDQEKGKKKIDVKKDIAEGTPMFFV